MNITYDKEIDALYMYLGKGDIDKTVSLANKLKADIDINGNILGIEILDASKQMEQQPAGTLSTYQIPVFQ